ncbi:L-serine ammonia-lyase [Microbacterium sp. MPKO10]|uniref:L-serine ammonia-lyase n=1 Tax=Microbacterium sp. MPKO10 TaxID=2989818 RepID=UPI002236BC1B|nr:L-serine ammonia-lyase [Microbacterium sp. MPKO10]MCW4457846.1 L-serine ammonia-lyase [Microbacterium sp. MPKO10]
MYVSVFDLFSIGIGPSSSHTVGPMRASIDFVRRLRESGDLPHVRRIGCALYGSLGATGLGHGTPDAIVAGLAGLEPTTCDPDLVRGAWDAAAGAGALALGGEHRIDFEHDDVALEPRTRLQHPNALTLAAWSDSAVPLMEHTYFSVGGGFIQREGDDDNEATNEVPLQYRSAEELLELCAAHDTDIAQIARRNEESLRGSDEVDAGLDELWRVMDACIDNGLATGGTLPGPLMVAKRAKALREKLETTEAENGRSLPGEWLLAYALAVNEENASGGRVVTAPTNGAAGIIPAVGRYYLTFVDGASVEGMRTYLLTATAIGTLFKANASISGAVGGCQAEVGSACAMAAGALCAVLGGTPAQVENAAEIAMEHHLGLTCDPVAGLVQVPCIERNAIASSTAVTAARLSLNGDGTHVVSLDAVIETMRQTGLDMSTKYKETSEGGLAVNVIEC